MRGVTSWLMNKETPPINHVSYLASEILADTYEEQTSIGWDQFIRGRISSKWGIMMRYAYDMIQSQNVHVNTTSKKRKFYSPDLWAKGLISLNWEYVNLLWVDRINSVKSSETGIMKNPNHYFLLQEAIYKLDNHQLTNPQDISWIIKSHDDLSKLLSNQLQLWINNLDLITKLNSQERKEENEEVTWR